MTKDICDFCMQSDWPWRLTILTLVLRTFGLIRMKLTFIVVYLALLYFDESQISMYLKTGAYLIENSTRVVEVGIDGPLQLFVVSLCSHQPRFESKRSSKPNLKVLCSSAGRSTGDSHKAFNIFVARLMYGRHCSGRAG